MSTHLLRRRHHPRRSPHSSSLLSSLRTPRTLAAATLCCLGSVSPAAASARPPSTPTPAAFVAGLASASPSPSPSPSPSSFFESRHRAARHISPAHRSASLSPPWLSPATTSLAAGSQGLHTSHPWSSSRRRRLDPLRALSSSSATSSGDDMTDPATTTTTSTAHAAGAATFRAALCQFLVGEDKQQNLDRAATFIKDAKKLHGAQLVVLPEIWNSPYATTAFPHYAELLPSVGQSYRELNVETQPSSHLLGSAAHEHQVWIVGGSIPEVDRESNEKNSKYYNTCLVFNPDGNVVAKHRKVHLFDIDVPNKIRFVESDTLSPGNALTSFESPFGIIGIGICYDLRFPEYSQVLAQVRGANILVFPGAFNLTTGPLHWELLQRGRAVDNQCWVLTASPARSSSASSSTTPPKYPPYVAWGHSSAVDPWGTVVATADENEAIVVVDVDLAKVDDLRTSIPIYPQRRNDLYTSAKPIA